MKIRNIITELKNSKWPSKKEVAVLTIYTLVLCGIIALIMLGLDLLLYFVRDWFLAL
ncbi:MAG: preprotein translocase subunit SecE [Candidatus Dojkabacteria bacterium]|jgi:preprotein translocase subunit SecE|nr:preprotein translocase subunit SecE [Candidatus Dojkabacteria bacterium]MDD4560830.1 preprotein translocase subunit SecE [Candidatus Dojkabacteria bacterium]NLB11767.1 preprotein translocase subunit SecE [Candidatus Dojkabacteria bacterium]